MVESSSHDLKQDSSLEGSREENLEPYLRLV
jgi:hypothetical protein